MTGQRSGQVHAIAEGRVQDISGHRRGRLVGWHPGGAPMVVYDQSPHGPLLAETTVAKTRLRRLASAADLLLAFLDERSDRPVIVGVLGGEERATPVPNESPKIEAPSAPFVSANTEVRIDGKRLKLEAHDEIELQCGKASIVLRKNGRLVIRGAFVESRSSGVNRIKGGSVKIN